MIEKDPDDIRGDLLTAVADIEEKTPGSTGNLADVQPKPVAPKAMDETGEAKPKTVGKDPATGKFTKAGDKPADVKAAAAAPSADSAKPETDGTKTPDAAPGTLPADIKAEWANLSPATKAFIAKRELDIGQAAGKAGHEMTKLKQQYEPLEAILGPRRAAVTAQHGSVEAWLDGVLKYSDFAGADPDGFLSWYLTQPNIASRVNLDKLLGAQPGQSAQGDVALANHPKVKQLEQTISGLTSRLQNFEGNIQTQRANSDISEIDAFENEKDASGNPMRPHFATLRDTGILGPQLQIINQQHPEWSIRQKIAAAYENAMWTHSDTRNAVLSQQQEKTREDEEAKKRADSASRARKFVSGQPPGPMAPASSNPKNDLRAEIAENFYAAVGGESRL